MVNASPRRAETSARKEVGATLQNALTDLFGAQGQIVSLERRPSPVQSSYALEELDVHLKSGKTLHLMFKDLSEDALVGAARPAKPWFLRDPCRELCVYRNILPGEELGTALYYGSVSDRQLGRYWLYLERVPGQELYQVGDFGIWRQVASWLARAHSRTLSPTCAPRLLQYDADFYRVWMRRAVEFTTVNPALGEQAANDLRRIASGYNRIIQYLVSLPCTFIHGEFYASNVLVVRPSQVSGGLVRVCPVDWEMAAIGPGLADLAALTSGKWNEDERNALAEAYYAALPASDAWPPPWPQFQFALDCCRLHLAQQWLGWSPAWEPPIEHAHNWFGEALRLANRLGL